MAQNFHPGQEREQGSASCASCRSSCSGQRSRLPAALFLSKIETFSLLPLSVDYRVGFATLVYFRSYSFTTITLAVSTLRVPATKLDIINISYLTVAVDIRRILKNHMYSWDWSESGAANPLCRKSAHEVHFCEVHGAERIWSLNSWPTAWNNEEALKKCP